MSRLFELWRLMQQQNRSLARFHLDLLVDPAKFYCVGRGEVLRRDQSSAENRARKFTVFAGTPHKNGKIEALSESMSKGTSASLFHSGMRPYWYYDAVSCWEFAYNALPSAANLWGAVAPNETLGLPDKSGKVEVFGSPCYINCTDEVTFEGVDRNGQRLKSLRRGKRGVYIGRSRDTEGAMAVDLLKREIVCNERVVVPDYGIAPVRDYIKDLRMSPFTAGKSKDAQWVWSVFDREPRVELLVEPTVDDDGIWDVLDEFGLPYAVKPCDDENLDEGVESGLVPHGKTKKNIRSDVTGPARVGGSVMKKKTRHVRVDVPDTANVCWHIRRGRGGRLRRRGA